MFPAPDPGKRQLSRRTRSTTSDRRASASLPLVQLQRATEGASTIDRPCVAAGDGMCASDEAGPKFGWIAVVEVSASRADIVTSRFSPS